MANLSRCLLQRAVPGLLLPDKCPSLCVCIRSLPFGTVTSTGEDKCKAKEAKEAAQNGDEEEGGRTKKGYGHAQKDPHEVAEKSHSEWQKQKEAEGREESLHETGFDISKRTRPSGDE